MSSWQEGKSFVGRGASRSPRAMTYVRAFHLRSPYDETDYRGGEDHNHPRRVHRDSRRVFLPWLRGGLLMPLSPAPAGTPCMAETSVEISVKGEWLRVPALDVDGKAIIVKGHWLKLAIIEAEEWMETALDDPERCVKDLKAQRSGKLHADVFTFTQKLPETTPKYKYPTERES